MFLVVGFYVWLVFVIAMITFVLGRKSIPSWPWRLFCSFIVGLGWPILFVYILYDWGVNVLRILVGWVGKENT